jgi:hypothetical protein
VLNDADFLVLSRHFEKDGEHNFTVRKRASSQYLDIFLIQIGLVLTVRVLSSLCISGATFLGLFCYKVTADTGFAPKNSIFAWTSFAGRC